MRTKYVGMAKAEKQKKVLAEGIRRKYAVCPLCAMNRVIEKGGEKGRIKFGNFNLAKSFIIQERACGGRDSGFYLDPEKSLTVEQFQESKEYSDLKEQIINQCQKIIEALS